MRIEYPKQASRLNPGPVLTKKSNVMNCQICGTPSTTGCNHYKPEVQRTTIEKSRYDNTWSAKSYVQLADPNRQLKISTFKNNRGYLYTSCQAVKIEPTSASGFSGESFLMFGDYTKTIKEFPEFKRVNEKVITQAHNLALTMIDSFIEEANAFYASKEGQQVVKLSEEALG